MVPYFYTTQEKNLLSEEFKSFIIENSLKNIDSFTRYITQKNKLHDGNCIKVVFWREILDITDRINLNSFPLIMMHHPNTEVIKHVDDPNKRNCVLSIPLFPKENYPPTFFYEKNLPDEKINDSELITTCHFDNMLPVFLNTQKIHNLKTYNSVRLNLQICFNEPFESVVNLYLNNKFFK